MSWSTEGGTGNHGYSCFINKVFRQLDIGLYTIDPLYHFFYIREGIKGPLAGNTTYSRDGIEFLNDKIMPFFEGLTHDGDTGLVSAERCLGGHLRDGGGV